MRCKDLIILIGAPGAGKSTFARKLEMFEYSKVVAFDDHAPRTAEEFANEWKDAYNSFIDNFVAALYTHKQVVVDSTNSSIDAIYHLLSYLPAEHEANIQYIYFPISLEAAQARRPYLPVGIIQGHLDRIAALLETRGTDKWITLGNTPATLVTPLTVSGGLVVG